MTQSVFVTGGSGLLGLHWACALRNDGRVTLGTHERDVRLSGVDTRRVSLESPDELAKTFTAIGCTAVVHTAGFTNVEACEADPARAQQVNVTLAGNVAAACARAEIPLAHISTDHLFGVSAEAISEDDPVSPVNVYGRTKAEAEARVLEAHPSAIVARTNFYGWGPSYRKSFSDTIITALRSGGAPRLFHDVFYTPILIEPLVRAVHGLIERRQSGVFHVTGDDTMSKYEFGRRIAREFGLDENRIVRTSIREMPELVARPARMVLSNRKTTKALGRAIGGVDAHLALLKQQEDSPTIQEIQRL